MSLINDALKRAKQAQDQNADGSSGSGPALEPAGPDQAALAGHGLSKRLPWLTLAGAAFLALVLVWQGCQRSSPNKNVRARALTPATNMHAAHPAPTPNPQVTETPPAPLPSAKISAAPASEPAATPAASEPTKQSASVATNPPVPTAPTVAVPPPAPAVHLKLQAIVFHPTHPSAIVNGKTLFLGEKMGEFELVAVDRQSATLVAGGRTNLLVLRR